MEDRDKAHGDKTDPNKAATSGREGDQEAPLDAGTGPNEADPHQKLPPGAEEGSTEDDEERFDAG